MSERESILGCAHQRKGHKNEAFLTSQFDRKVRFRRLAGRSVCVG